MKSKTMVIFIVLFLSVFIMLVSCKKQKTEWKGKIEIIDGVKVVHNLQPNQMEAFKTVEFVEDLSIGIEEGDENYMFNNPVDIDSDSEGNIYVLDYQDCVIKKYDPLGRFVAQFCRKGQGPGEFTSPYSMTISHQNLVYIGDYMLRKIEVLSPAGDYQKTIKVDFLYFFSINKKNDLITGHQGYDEDGNRFYNVGRFDFQKNEAVDFFAQRQYWPARIMNDEFRYDFPYYVRWDINSKDHIYVASAVDYEISVFSPDGNLLFKFSKDFDHVKVSGEEMKKISKVKGRGPNPFMANPVYPVFRFISIDEKDRVWIEHYKPSWRGRVNKETVYDIFSFDGKFLFSTKITGHIYPQLIFKNNYIYAFRKDDSGYSKAIRLKINE